MTKTKTKLSKRARKKEATGIQVEAAKKRDRVLELRISVLEIDMQGVWQRLKKLEKRKK